MVAFLVQTWLLWWFIAVVAILRWFHVVSADKTWEEIPLDEYVGESYSMHDQVSSSPS